MLLSFYFICYKTTLNWNGPKLWGMLWRLLNAGYQHSLHNFFVYWLILLSGDEVNLLEARKTNSSIFVNLFFFSTCRTLSSFVAVVFCKWGFMHFCLTSSFYDTLTFSESDYLIFYTVWGLFTYIDPQINALCLCNASIREIWSMWESTTHSKL